MYAKWMNSEQQCYKARTSSEQVDVVNCDEEADEGPHMEEVHGQVVKCIGKYIEFHFFSILKLKTERQQSLKIIM
jgi:hypothetical protein